MPPELRITCINRTMRTKAHERIRNIGGVGPDAQPWKLAETHAIADIKRGRHSFYVERPDGRRASVIVASLRGREYLKTDADGEQPENLLMLPECPT